MSEANTQESDSQHPNEANHMPIQGPWQAVGRRSPLARLNEKGEFSKKCPKIIGFWCHLEPISATRR